MARPGHGTTRAAPIRRHADHDRERETADAVDGVIVKVFERGPDRDGRAGGTDA